MGFYVVLWVVYALGGPLHCGLEHYDAEHSCPVKWAGLFNVYGFINLLFAYCLNFPIFSLPYFRSCCLCGAIFPAQEEPPPSLVLADPAGHAGLRHVHSLAQHRG